MNIVHCSLYIGLNDYSFHMSNLCRIRTCMYFFHVCNCIGANEYPSKPSEIKKCTCIYPVQCTNSKQIFWITYIYVMCMSALSKTLPRKSVQMFVCSMVRKTNGLFFSANKMRKLMHLLHLPKCVFEF